MDILQEKVNRKLYQQIEGLDKHKRDKRNRIILEPKLNYLEHRDEKLSSSINDLESKLMKFKAEKEKTDKAIEVAYEKEGKKKDKKKDKKKKKTILKMIFNAADSQGSGADEDDLPVGEYKDKKERKKAEKKKEKETTLDTGTGQRFSPVVSLLYDSITEFDELAAELQKDLDNKGTTKSMYRSSQTANLIAVKTAKLRAVTELGSISKTITDIEMKKAKEENKGDNDTTRAINSLGIKMLRGAFDDEDDIKEKKKNKKDKKKRLMDDDDEDDDFYKKKKSSDNELAQALANKIGGKGSNFTFTAHERHIEIEGKYSLIVVMDPMDEDDWKFVAVDNKGNRIPNFKEEYPGLMPKRKNSRMTFDKSKMQAIDKNHGNKKYRLVFKDND